MNFKTQKKFRKTGPMPLIFKDENDNNPQWVHPGPAGEKPDFPFDEFREWMRPDASSDPFWMTVKTLAQWAGVTRATVYDWEIRPGFPARGEFDLIDAYRVWWWRYDRDQMRTERQRTNSGRWR